MDIDKEDANLRKLQNKMNFLFNFIVLFFNLQPKLALAECGHDVTTTETGSTCDSWRDLYNWGYGYDLWSFPDDSWSELGNKCRDPDNTGWPWCYYGDGYYWGYCYHSCDELPAVHPSYGDCKVTHAGLEYTGDTSIATNGLACYRWQHMSATRRYPIDYFPDSSYSDLVNKCRNPDSDSGGPWCYTSTGWAYCDVPFCDADDCVNNACENGAQCIDGVNSYSCDCIPGYTGTYCQIEIDECDPNPCSNNQPCNDGINSATCSCEAGYAGTLCEIDIDECEDNACENGAQCIDGVNTYNCDCTNGYTGTYCQIDIDECDPNLCSNDQPCNDGINSFTCSCEDGYAGTLCEIDIDECEDNACENGAQCIDGVNSYGCDCISGYTGVYCQIDTDECEPNPCLNNQQCNDGINSFTCDCDSGYMGTLCETDNTIDSTDTQINPSGTTAQPSGNIHSDTTPSYSHASTVPSGGHSNSTVTSIDSFTGSTDHTAYPSMSIITSTDINNISSTIETSQRRDICSVIPTWLGFQYQSEAWTPHGYSVKISYKCNDGYRFEDNSTSKHSWCRNGHWRPSLQECEAIPVLEADPNFKKPVEAPHAVVVGTGGIIFVCVELTILFIADLNTFKQNILNGK